MNAARGKALAWLCHPVTVTALALLIINDHLLKSAWPGWVTGKLSDAAGMVLAPPLLAALAGLIAPRLPFRRVAAAAIVTVGAGFIMVKLWGYGAQLASEAWSLITPSLVRADPSDLLACPFLALAWWTAGRPLEGVRARRWMRALRLAVVLPAALFGVAATSATPTPTATAVVVEGDAVYLVAHDEGHAPAWSVSRDGGRTFVDTDPLPAWRRPGDPGASASYGVAPSAPVAVGTSDCARSTPVICYRVADENRIAVESRTGDGPWQEYWSLSRAQWSALKQGYPYEDSTHLSSNGLAVLDVPGGHVLVVANGRDGFAVRDEAGSWRRIGFPALPDDEAPLDLPDADAPVITDDTPGVAALSLGAFLSGLVLTCAGVQRAVRAGRSRAWWLLPAPFPVILLCALPASVLAWDGMPELAGFMAVVTVAASLTLAVSALVVGRAPAEELARAIVLILVALGVAYLIWLLVGRRDPLILLPCLTVGALVAAPGVFRMLRLPRVTPAAAEFV
ncbi:hypothetical protein [Actinoplanes xinjiangensis]|uniref:hypothetical protein n=1 Tax=Actinoplanes xinjiangensis TaxID=512350 RepID=UPI0034338AA6